MTTRGIHHIYCTYCRKDVPPACAIDSLKIMTEKRKTQSVDQNDMEYFCSDMCMWMRKFELGYAGEPDGPQLYQELKTRFYKKKKGRHAQK